MPYPAERSSSRSVRDRISNDQRDLEYVGAPDRHASPSEATEKELWAQEQTFYGSRAHSDTIKVPWAFVERLTEAVCYAA